MTSLIHLFSIAVTYPILNVLVWLYLQVHNFALAIILLSCLRSICLFWPRGYLRRREQVRRDSLRPLAQIMVEDIQRSYALYGRAYDRHAQQIDIAKAYKEHGITRHSIYSRLSTFLSLLSWYIIFGMYFALIVLGGSSLQGLNGVLYPALPHLTTLPDYRIVFLGQTISLVQRGIPPTFLIAFALIILTSRYLAAKQSVGWMTDRLCRLGCTFLLVSLNYFLSAGFTIIVAWLFATGALLDGITSSLLDILVSIAKLVQASKDQRNGNAREGPHWPIPDQPDEEP